jgi:ribonucleoside-diphosphate reductase alpha chain
MAERPEKLSGYTISTGCGCGKLYITINESEDKSYKEVFFRLGKAGGCPMSWCDAIGRLITFSLNSGVKKEQIIRALSGIRCPNPTVVDGEQIHSCPDAIASVLKRYLSV